MEFTVTVIHDPECDMWVGVCDELPIATESETYEGLIEQAWLIAPEIFVENKHPGRVEDMRLSFVHTQAWQPSYESLQPA